MGQFILKEINLTKTRINFDDSVICYHTSSSVQGINKGKSLSSLSVSLTLAVLRDMPKLK